ncbi:MAG: hypothetical protein M3N50_13145 [Pseudomonadota bacterium]|nr:hypothetical protein [Pseudomonadota bacterium]
MPSQTIQRPGSLARCLVPLATALVLTATAAAGSVLSLGPRTLQTLIAEQLFNQRGRWYLIDDGGVCFTYLDSPRVRLETDRVVLDAHLSSRLGQRIGDSCAGAVFASNVTLSAKLHGTEHKLTLDDIRIDRVDDEATRNALDLALQLDPRVLPRTASIDVFEFMQKLMASTAAPPPHVEQFRISNIAAHSDAVVIQFDLSLKAP